MTRGDGAWRSRPRGAGDASSFAGLLRHWPLQELRVECFFPADRATDALARRLAGA